MRVYISGKMTGVEKFNYPLFNRVAKEFRDAGVEVENPAEHFGGDTALPRAVYLSHDYKILTSTVDGVRPSIDLLVLLPGWEDSSGSRSEKAVAEAMGIGVAYYDNKTGVKGIIDTDTEVTGVDVVNKEIDALLSACKLSRGESVVVDADTGGRKGIKLARFDLIPPKALWHTAEVYGFGSQKYDDNNWRKGYDWKLSYGALQRHAWAFWGGEDLDPESGLPHMAHAAWHCFTLMTYMEEQRAKDSRWKGTETKA